MGLEEHRENLASDLYDSFERSLGTEAATLILSNYSIFRHTEDYRAAESVLNMANDIAYCVPTITYALNFPRNAYIYKFTGRNPWCEQFRNLSTHYLDAVFLFQNYNEHGILQGSQTFGIDMAKDFIAFANGTEPWEKLDLSGTRPRVHLIGEGEENHDRYQFLYNLLERLKNMNTGFGDWSKAWDGI